MIVPRAAAPSQQGHASRSTWFADVEAKTTAGKTIQVNAAMRAKAEAMRVMKAVTFRG
jgi:hypothetical protein